MKTHWVWAGLVAVGVVFGGSLVASGCKNETSAGGSDDPGTGTDDPGLGTDDPGTDDPGTDPLTTGANWAEFEDEALEFSGCDDEDDAVTIDNVTNATFTLSGLTGNGPLTVTITDATHATVNGVVQYAKQNHKLDLLWKDATHIGVHIESTEGSCDAEIIGK